MACSYLRPLPLLPVLFFVGCTVTTSSSNPSNDGGGVQETPDSGTTPTPSEAVLSFKPSNIDLKGVDVSKVGDFVVDRANCQISTESKLTGCGDMDKLAFVVVDQ